MLKSLLHSEVKVIITNDDIRWGSISATNKTTKLTKFSINTKLSFTQLHSGALGDIETFVQKIPGT